jgi:hypothetical protein
MSGVHVDEESIDRATNWWAGEEKEKKWGNLLFFFISRVSLKLAGASEKEKKKRERERKKKGGEWSRAALSKSTN